MADPTPELTIPDATLHPAEYKQALLDAAADADLVEAIAQAPVDVGRLVQGVDPALLHTPMAPGEWSAADIVGHLLDVDVVYGFRWRLVLTEDTPHYPGYDEKRWTLLPRLPFPGTLAAWTALRAVNVALVRGAAPSDWARTGVHAEQGAETFEETVRKVVGHDLAHLNQLRRTLEAVATGPG